MTVIICNGERLDLPADYSIAITVENAFLVQDKIPAPFSLEIPIPPTQTNLRLLEYPTRMTARLQKKEYASHIYHSDLKLMSGIIYVQSSTATEITICFVGVFAPENITKPLYELPYPRYEFPSLETVQIEQLKELYLAGAQGAYGWIPVPLRNLSIAYEASSQDVWKPQYYLSPFNPRSGNHAFTEYRTDGRTYEEIYRQYPLLRVSSLLNIVFGGRLDIDPSFLSQVNDLVLISNFWDHYPYKGVSNAGLWYDIVDGHTIYYFSPNKMANRYPANEIVKQLLTLFCSSIFQVGERFALKHNKDVLSATDFVDWSGKLQDGYSIAVEKGQTYKCIYSQNKADSPGVTPTPIASIAAMFNYIGQTHETTLIFKIDKTNAIYSRRLNADNTVDYALIDDGLYHPQQEDVDAPDDENLYDMTVNISPVQTNIHRIYTNGPYGSVSHWLVPQITPETERRPDTVQIGIYHGMRPTLWPAGQSYPYVSNNGYDTSGNRLTELSLVLDGTDGIRQRYHAPFAQWLAKDKVTIAGDLLLSAYDIKTLDTSRKIYLLGRLFFIRQITFTLSNEGLTPAEVELVEA